MADEMDLSMVAAKDITAVLELAADILAADREITALKAITTACDKVAGRGVDTAEIHTACLDAVCVDIFGRRQGNNASVSRWERQLNQKGWETVRDVTRQRIVTEFRRIARDTHRQQGVRR